MLLYARALVLSFFEEGFLVEGFFAGLRAVGFLAAAGLAAFALCCRPSARAACCAGVCFLAIFLVSFFAAFLERGRRETL